MARDPPHRRAHRRRSACAEIRRHLSVVPVPLLGSARWLRQHHPLVRHQHGYRDPKAYGAGPPRIRGAVSLPVRGAQEHGGRARHGIHVGQAGGTGAGLDEATLLGAQHRRLLPGQRDGPPRNRIRPGGPRPPVESGPDPRRCGSVVAHGGRLAMVECHSDRQAQPDGGHSNGSTILHARPSPEPRGHDHSIRADARRRGARRDDRPQVCTKTAVHRGRARHRSDACDSGHARGADLARDREGSKGRRPDGAQQDRQGHSRYHRARSDRRYRAAASGGRGQRTRRPRRGRRPRPTCYAPRAGQPQRGPPIRTRPAARGAEGQGPERGPRRTFDKSDARHRSPVAFRSHRRAKGPASGVGGKSVPDRTGSPDEHIAPCACHPGGCAHRVPTGSPADGHHRQRTRL